MSKKLFLAVLPLLALAMASCSRGNGGASSQSGGSSSAAGDSSEVSQESEESSEEEEEEETLSVELGEESPHTFTVGSAEYKLYVDPTYDSRTDEWGGKAKFTSEAISVTEGQAISVTANPTSGDPVDVYVNEYDKSGNVEGEHGSYTVKSTASNCVLTLYQYDDGWAFLLSGYTPSGEEEEEGGETPATGTVRKVTANREWENTYVYLWKGEGGEGNQNAAWPGVKLSDIDSAPEDNGYGSYNYNVDFGDYEYIIINGGSDTKKTGDGTLAELLAAYETGFYADAGQIKGW